MRIKRILVLSLCFLFITSGFAQSVKLTRTAQTCVYKADFLNIYSAFFAGDNIFAIQRKTTNSRTVELYDCSTGALLGSYKPYRRIGGDDIECPVFFEEGRSMAKFENGSFCIIDRNAKVIKEIKGAVEAYPFSQGLAFVLFKNPTDRSRYIAKFYDREGNELNQNDYKPFETNNYFPPYALRDGRRRYYNKGKYGYFDADGKLIIDYKFEYAEDFSDGLASVSTDGDYYGVIDTNGNYVIEEKFRNKPGLFSNGYAAIKKVNNRYAIIDKKGSIYQDLEFYYLSRGHFGYFFGEIMDSKIIYVLVDTNTDTIFDLKGNIVDDSERLTDIFTQEGAYKQHGLFLWTKGWVKGFPSLEKASPDLKYFFVHSPTCGIIDRLGQYIIVFEESEL